MQYTLENEVLKVVIDSHGAEIVSVKSRDTDKEYIWQADPSVWERHAPVLFPIVGKCKDNKYTYEEKEYTLSSHGFARDSEFELVSKDSDSIVMKLTSDENTRKAYPFDFELLCMYEVYGNTVTTDWRVVNTGSDTMYFSIGGHPAFVDGDSLIGAKVIFDDAEQKLTYKLLNSEGVVDNAVTHELELKDKACQIEKSTFAKNALIIENGQCHSVTLADKSDAPIVKVTFDAPVFGVWSKNTDVPFVCIEPWYGRADGADADGDITHKEWIQELDCYSEFKAGFTTYFY